jgi:hypothetical protein
MSSQQSAITNENAQCRFRNAHSAMNIFIGDRRLVIAHWKDESSILMPS